MLGAFALIAVSAAIRLTYAAPPECPAEPAFRAQLGARLGYDPVREPAAQDVSVTVQKSDSSIVATLKIANDKERSFPGAANECERILEGLALALAIAIDPAATVRPRRPAAAPITPAVEAPAAPAPAPEVNIMFAGGLRSGIGLLPNAGFGPVVEGRVRYRAFSAAVDVDAVFAPALVVEGRRIATSVVRASAAACAHAALFALCLRGAVGGLYAAGSGFENARSGWLGVASVGPTLGLTWSPITNLVLQASAALELVLSRPALAVGPREVWRAPLIAGTVTIFAGWQLR